MTKHISKLGENVDPGSDKTTDTEHELNAAGNLKEDDNESVGVMSEVGDTTKDANGKDVDSPYSDLVNVGSSFVYTVDKNKIDKNQNISKILAEGVSDNICHKISNIKSFSVKFCSFHQSLSSW